MDQLRPIFWGQGMFLQPQHFQPQDGYHEARLRYALQLLYPFCWGVQALSINETALRNFLVEVEQCELITSEGTPVRFQGASLPSNARIMPRSCEAALVPDEQPLGVYRGVERLQGLESPAESILVFLVSTAHPLALGWRLTPPHSKEHVMHSLLSLVHPMLADRRYGCRGDEVATNMQRRKIPCW